MNLSLILLLLYGLSPCNGGGGGGSLFDRNNIDPLVTSISILGCIIFTLLMEVALNRLEHIAKGDEAKGAFVHKMYEEMIILGFFSFGLILLIDFQVFSGEASYAALVKFEFAHLWLFMFGMFMVLQNVLGFRVIVGIERNWLRADNLGLRDLLTHVDPKFLLDNLHLNEVVMKKEEKTELSNAKPYQPRMKCVSSIFGGGHIFDCMEYEAMKHIFLTQNDQIESEESFRFAKYLQRATSESISEHLEHVSYVKWAILIAVAVAYIALIDNWNHHEPHHHEDLWFSFSYAMSLGLVSVILMVMTRNGKMKMISMKAREKWKGSDAYSDQCPPEDYAKLLVEVYTRRQQDKITKAKMEREEKADAADDPEAAESHEASGRSRSGHGHNQAHGKHGGGHGHGHGGDASGNGLSGGELGHGCFGRSFVKDEEDVMIENGKGLLPCKMKTSHMLWMNDMVTLLQCFYLGLFVTLISSLAIKDLGPLYGCLFIFAIFAEQSLVMLWTGPSLVKDVVLIQSMLHANHEIVEEVLDEVLELKKIRQHLIAGINAQFKDTKNKKEALRKCYDSLDKDGGGTLGSKELKALFITSLKTKVHGRQCDLIIQEMDQDLSGEVDFEEFLEYLQFDKMMGTAATFSEGTINDKSTSIQIHK